MRLRKKALLADLNARVRDGAATADDLRERARLDLRGLGRRGRPLRALRDLTAAMAMDRPTAEDYLLRAGASRALGDHGAALADLEAALAVCENGLRARILAWRAFALSRLGRHTEAAAGYGEAAGCGLEAARLLAELERLRAAPVREWRGSADKDSNGKREPFPGKRQGGSR